MKREGEWLLLLLLCLVSGREEEEGRKKRFGIALFKEGLLGRVDAGIEKWIGSNGGSGDNVEGFVV